MTYLPLLPLFLLPYVLLLCKKNNSNSKKRKKEVENPKKIVYEEEHFRRHCEREMRHVETLPFDEQAAIIEKWNRTPPTYPEEDDTVIRMEFSMVYTIYRFHDCQNPEKSTSQEDSCKICAEFIQWTARKFRSRELRRLDITVKHYLIARLYYYGGRLPDSVESNRDYIVFRQDKDDMLKRMNKEGTDPSTIYGSITGGSTTTSNRRKLGEINAGTNRLR